MVGTYERETLLSSLGLTTAKTLGYEGSEGKIDDLRHFINFGINVSSGSFDSSLVIWDADKLSPECQAVLLKPLENASESMSMFLIASNENGLLPTIISRCLVSSQISDDKKDSSFWKEILECFAKGPSKCLSLADEIGRAHV